MASLHSKGDSFSLYFTSILDITKNELIGKGSFGAVYKGKYKDAEVAVKELLGTLDDVTYREFVKEVTIMGY